MRSTIVWIKEANCKMKHLTYLAVLIQVSIFMSTLLADKYYVKPDPMNCHGQLCLTVEQVDSFVTTGSTFVFLAGNHTLENGIFLSSVSNVTFSAKTLINILWTDTAIYGYNLTNMTIQGLSFRLNDYKQKTGSALEIYDSSGIFITDSIFQGSGDLRKGKVQAIFIFGTIMKILSCLFEENTGNFGGAIYASDESEITIINSTFLNNKALFSGGALNAETVVTVDGSLFRHNFARASGGTIDCVHCVVSIIGHNTFENNYLDHLVSVTSSGGAISVRESKMFISGKAYFFNNSAVQGGAIIIVDSYAEIVGREIICEENTAYYYYGGALAILISSVILNTTFIHNVAESSGGPRFHW